MSYVGYGSSASGIRVSAASTDFLKSSMSERTVVWYAFAFARGSSVASALAVSAFKVSRPVEISSASCDSSLISFPSEAVLTSETTDFVDKQQAAANFQKAYLDKDYDEDEEVKIIRTKKFGIKPMYPEDACVQMELLGHNFFVFYNAETEQVNVVYKRKGNTYGLIEPEF